MYAITPRGAGNQPGARRIEKGWKLTAGETFVAEVDSVDGLVLAENGNSLRAETEKDRGDQKDKKVDTVVDALFLAQDNIKDAVLKQIIIDVAGLLKKTPEEYQADLTDRVKAR